MYIYGKILLAALSVGQLLLPCNGNEKTARPNPLKAKEYQTIVKDGAYCILHDPRAVYHKGKYEKAYIGWISSKGDIGITSYNYADKKVKHFILHPEYQINDHDHPSILILPDGKLLVHYTGHGGKYIHQRISKNPEDISEWGEEKQMLLNPKDVKGRKSQTFSNIVMLSKENNRIYTFFQGLNGKPTMSYTDDFGKNWAPGQQFISHLKAKGTDRPEAKYHCDGNGTIHMAFTDNDPRKASQNSIYYMKFSNGKFTRADGSLVGTLKD